MIQRQAVEVDFGLQTKNLDPQILTKSGREC
jgi:hypothetical protein